MLRILCGHGNGDSGACGCGYQEQERVRVLAGKIKELGGSQVEVFRPDLDPYRNQVPSWVSIGASDIFLELHMDSAAAGARGGHVIIKSGFKADAYDTALASVISSMFPGRSNTIVGRSDLYTVNTAAARGMNYRLLECCFISNSQDMAIFNANISNLAQRILSCFGIKTVSPAATPAQKPEEVIKNDKVRRIGGAGRYDTNLLMISEMLKNGASKDELIVVSGTSFADALSAASAGKPIMLVGERLTKAQSDFLKAEKFKKVTIVGGTGAVSVLVQNEISRII